MTYLYLFLLIFDILNKIIIRLVQNSYINLLKVRGNL